MTLQKTGPGQICSDQATYHEISTHQDRPSYYSSLYQPPLPVDIENALSVDASQGQVDVVEDSSNDHEWLYPLSAGPQPDTPCCLICLLKGSHLL